MFQEMYYVYTSYNQRMFIKLLRIVPVNLRPLFKTDFPNHVTPKKQHPSDCTTMKPYSPPKTVI
jgi:hypothetical protein